MTLDLPFYVSLSGLPLFGARELLPRVELGTSSLPRMRSTTELKQHFLLLRRGRSLLSGKRDSNPRPPAWKASALSTELFPRDFSSRKNLAQVLASPSCKCKHSLVLQKLPQNISACVGADGFEPPKSKDSRFTVCPIWPLWNTPFVGIRLRQSLPCGKEVAAVPPLRLKYRSR